MEMKLDLNFNWISSWICNTLVGVGEFHKCFAFPWFHIGWAHTLETPYPLGAEPTKFGNTSGSISGNIQWKHDEQKPKAPYSQPKKASREKEIHPQTKVKGIWSAATSTNRPNPRKKKKVCRRIYRSIYWNISSNCRRQNYTQMWWQF